MVVVWSAAHHNWGGSCRRRVWAQDQLLSPFEACVVAALQNSTSPLVWGHGSDATESGVAWLGV